jgi:hypothetical protein
MGAIVMPGHSRPKDGVAEPVIGTRDFARSRWLAYVQSIHALLYCRMRGGWVH